MGSYRSNEDDVSRISTSIFVMIFPNSFSAKDLFHSCKQYGHVLDTFIPSKRSKAGKRFGFVRFINVFNVKRLEKKDVGINRSGTNVPSKDVGVTGTGKSYVHVVKGNNMSRTMVCDSIPTIVLDDKCLYSKDLSKSLLGMVKEFASLSNLKTALINEGFVDIKIQYMGELWVLLEFPLTKSIELFHENVGVGSWFSVLRQTSIDFNSEGRIVKVEIEGIPFKLWSGNTFKRIAAKWGGLLDVDDQEEMCFHSKRSNTTISDYFIMIRGVWLKTGVNLIIVAVYAPHDLRDKHTWSEAPGNDSNAMRSMMRKLKYLKVKIQEWNNGNMNNTKRAIEKYKEELEALDAAIDKGNGSDDIVNKRMEVIKSMHHIDKIQAMDMAQKAKIKWSIEGDENS
uniref:Nucleotide-binding alpha-beta plait domain-containing protein n=1 Tax=Tanacetum cinerariifolium TaxID=118510 RepID=A0A6L2LN28_TANCI|nr:nucleotide-binding alpha-beta plait domain-containing protein [Tanacetum cinerariifolium]